MSGWRAGRISVLLAVLPLAAAHADEKCRKSPVAHVHLEHIDGRLALPVTVQGVPVYMFLNTASELSGLAPAAARRFGFVTRELPKQAIVANGKDAKVQAHVPHMDIGELELTDQHFAVYPDESTLKWPDTVIGVMGIDLLWSYDIDLDVVKGELALYRPGDCRAEDLLKGDYVASLPLRRSPLGSFYFVMNANGRKLETAFSTGGAWSTIPRSLLRRAYGIRDAVDTISMRLDAGSLQFDHETVHVTDDPEGMCRLARKADAIGYENCFTRYPLILGTDILSRLHLFIATQQSQLYFALINLT